MIVRRGRQTKGRALQRLWNQRTYEDDVAGKVGNSSSAKNLLEKLRTKTHNWKLIEEFRNNSEMPVPQSGDLG